MGVMNPLLSRLSNILVKEYAQLRGVRRQIAFLWDELNSMSAALEMLSEAEEENPQVKEWMCQLRELSYDMEDCIEIFMLHLGHDETCAGFIHRITSKVITLKARLHVANRINELKERVLEVSDRRKRYEINLSDPCSNSVVIDPRLPALFDEADKLVGIDIQMHRLVKWLTSGTDLHPQRKVLSIVGFGGLGKTTLANQFLKSSTSIADDQNQDTVKMQENLYLRKLEYPQLVSMNRDYLRNKRYLVIIDDIWSKQSWKQIQCAFPDNSNASRIMTTTRIEEVAKFCCFPHNEYVYPMKPLDSNDSKRLFVERIFNDKDACPLELNEVTDDILRKCQGLPLALVNIASLLATKPTTKHEWERVRNSLGSALEQDHELEVVQRILFVSYYDLPHYLKICLLDLSIFPEDNEIARSHLIRRWIAEGYIAEQRGQCLADTAENYISELINRNMIEPVDIDYSGRPRACRVHDIMLDLIISLSSKENFVTIMDGRKLAPANKIRRLSLQGYSEEQKLLHRTNSLSHVRSLNIFGDVKVSSLLDFQVLRVLNVQNCSILEDDDIENIGQLTHLRYLNLDCSNIRTIPRQIGKLQHLQTLDLMLTKIEELPAAVAQLRQLVCLLVRRGVRLPNGISNMRALQELSVFDVGRNSTDVVHELGSLSKLNVLFIHCHLDDAISDEGRYKKSLISSLRMLGERNLRCLRIETETGSTMDFLVDSWCPPPHHLQMLDMFGLVVPIFSRLPKWISSLYELTFLEISIKRVGSKDVQALADLPALICVKIYTKEYPHDTLTISADGFQCLKEFWFFPRGDEMGLMYLERKNDRQSLMFQAGAMPRLERLRFRFSAHDALSTHNIDFDFGISHLSSLKHLLVRIDCQDARTWEVEAAEAAVRNAVALLPNHPTTDMHRWLEEEMVKEEG
ncbi:unnamed protein product [Urochloa decumbens]|uniref:Disease resistance protein RPM1 n=1 Tax=Urochloa decumbens TaxID=240449 RepID=A0ABC9BUT7_9POAL